MKFLRKIFCILMACLVLFVGARYLMKEKFFPYKYAEYVEKYSNEYKLDPLFVLSVMKAESNFNEEAHSHKSAVGLMQVTVDTGQWIAGEMDYIGFTKDDLYNEEINIKFGCWYLNRLNYMFDNNVDLVIAAYNAGPTNVQNWLLDNKYSKDGKNVHYIPFGETKKYVDKVNTYYSVYKYLYNDEEIKSVFKTFVELIQNR